MSDESTSRSLCVYCDTRFPPDAEEALARLMEGHTLVRSVRSHQTNLEAAPPDAAAADAEVIFGQPSLDTLRGASALRWVQLTSAGYARYDTAEARALLRDRQIALSTSSGVYAVPCAEQALAAMLMFSRWLDRPLREAASVRGWPAAQYRRGMRLLRGARVVLLGYGAIAQRLAALLAPFEVQLWALRRHPTPGDAAMTVSLQQLPALLRSADHVVDLLPGNPGTVGFMNAERLGLLPPHAYFYNIGRGSTVDGKALLGLLDAGRLAGAYLDVTDPEPLPPGDPLWQHPRCLISPHVAGGWRGEQRALVAHFGANLARYLGGESLENEVC